MEPRLLFKFQFGLQELLYLNNHIYGVPIDGHYFLQAWVESVRKCTLERHPTSIEIDDLYKLKLQVIILVSFLVFEYCVQLFYGT